MNEEPIFILGAHKSGTTLLRSLLSGHPDVFAIPFETHFYAMVGEWIQNDYRKQSPVKVDESNFHQRFQNFIAENNVAVDPKGDTFVKGKFDLERFAARMAELKHDDHEQLQMQHYFAALHESLMGDMPAPNVRFIEKSVENAEFSMELMQLFPKAKFVQIVRNPYSNFVSLRKYKSIGFGFPLIFRLIRTLQNNYYWLYKNRRLMPDDRYRRVRYEDLLRNPEAEMRGLASFLGLEFQESLLQPTLLGEHWGGNSTTGKQFKGIDASNLDKWKKDILPMEVFFINKLFPFVLKDYGYEQMETPKGYWKRGKGESLKRWVINRLYKYYLRPFV